MTIRTKDRDGADLDIAAENRSGVEYPLNHMLDAAGNKIDPATEATLAALNVIAAAVQTAVQAINAKTTAINTGAIAGTVALDSGTLAALETINANTGALTNAELRAAAVPVSGTFWQATQPVSGPLTDTQLRATAVPVSGTFWQATQPVSFSWAGLTDAQLRASAVPVSFTWAGLTDAQLRASAVPVSGPLTDTQLRSTAVPVSGTFWQTTQPVSADSLPLPTGAATEATLATLASAAGMHDGEATDGRAGFVVLVRRRDSDAEPMVADGDLTYLNIDEEGRLKVASKPASYPDITGSITAVQATIGTPVAGGTVSGDVSRASNVMAFCTGTFSTVNCTFEGSLEATGDTNWFTVQAIRSNANTIETTTGNLSAQPVYAWELSVNALRRLRVRCTARTSGTQNWRFVLGTYATEPIPGAQASATQPVSGTVTTTIGTAGLVVYTDSSTNLGIGATFTGTSRDSGATPAYNRFIVNAVADQAGTVRVEKSTDNAAWRRATADIAVEANVPRELDVRVTARYHRVVYVNGGVAQTQFLLTSAYQRI